MATLRDFREMKDAFFRASSGSPLTREQKKAFEGLRYFEEKPALRFRVRLETYAKPERVQMQTSTGHVAPYLKYAAAHFVVNGQPQALQVYKSEEQDTLFLPFADATTGKESYGAGRYLDPEEEADGTITLDFNLAYNPYCAYNEEWSCPLPPRENRLAVRIEAGEQSFHEDETHTQ